MASLEIKILTKTHSDSAPAEERAEGRYSAQYVRRVPAMRLGGVLVPRSQAVAGATGLAWQGGGLMLPKGMVVEGAPMSKVELEQVRDFR